MNGEITLHKETDLQNQYYSRMEDREDRHKNTFYRCSTISKQYNHSSKRVQTMVTLKKQVPVSRALKTAVHDMRGLQKWWLGVRNPQHIWREACTFISNNNCSCKSMLYSFSAVLRHHAPFLRYHRSVSLVLRKLEVLHYLF